MKPLRLLATGLTGFIGRYLLDEIQQSSDWEITALVRPRSAEAANALKSKSPLRVNVVEANIRDLWTAKLPRVQFDAVINLVGPRSNNAGAQWRANVEYVRELTFLLSHVRVNRLVHVSSAAVYGVPRGTRSITEADAPKPADWYGITKLIGERIVERYHKESGIPVTILRPSWVVGVGSRLLDKQLVRAHQRGIRLIIPLRTPINFVYVRDLAKTIVSAVQRTSVGLEVYNVNSPERIPFCDFLAVIDREVKRTKLPVVVPVWVLRVMSLKFPFVRALLADSHFDASKAINALGFCPSNDLSSMAKEIGAQATQ